MNRMTRLVISYIRPLALALVLAATSAGLIAFTPFSASASAVTPQSQVLASDPQLSSDPFIRSELYFGTNRAEQPPVSDEEWESFLDNEITPRFPDGLTVLKGYGQFRNSDGVTIEERSIVLILLYPQETRKESSAKIEEIRDLYEESFDQESVLRVDDMLPARVSF